MFLDFISINIFPLIVDMLNFQSVSFVIAKLTANFISLMRSYNFISKLIKEFAQLCNWFYIFKNLFIKHFTQKIFIFNGFI